MSDGSPGAVGPGPRVGIVPGPGVVARFGPTIAVFGAEASPDEPFTAAWLQLLSRWSTDAATPAETIAWRAAELLVAHRATAPAWGAAIRIANGYLVLLRGPARAQMDTPAGRTELSGAQDLTFLDRRFDDPVNRVALSVAPSGAITEDPRSDLRGGLVPGGSGAVLTTSGPHSDAPAPLTDRHHPPAGWPSNGAAGQVAPRPPTAPVPVEHSDAHRPPPQIAETQGVQETQAVRATAGSLVADDGTRTILDRAYVFGRDPANDPAVVRGLATPISIEDPDQLISRVHARVAPVGGVVTVCDIGSANGTYIAPPGAREWTRIGSEPAVLARGWSMRLGGRVYTHAAPDGQTIGTR